MILNIIDRRINVHRWKSVAAIIESTWHENACHDADQAEQDYREPSFAARKCLSLTDAVAWASSLDVPLTLYLYDAGSEAVSEDWLSNDEVPDQHLTR